MIATFAMYDWPEQSDHWDVFWTILRNELTARGIAAPERLSRGGNVDAYWTAPDLVVGQTCGLPYRARLHDNVTLIGALDHGLPGCPPGYYNSVVIMRADDARGHRAALSETLACNAADSQSGWAALAELARAAGVEIRRARRSGSHRESARLVAEGAADLAAIDAETWRLIEAYDPDVARRLSVVERTSPRPGLPLITRSGVDAAPYADAIGAAINATPRATRDALHVRGFERIAAAAYLALPLPPAPPES